MMIEKEITELRRRLRNDKNNITHIRGCYVNDIHEIVSVFDEGIGFLPKEDVDRYFSLFRKVLSGGIGVNLIDVAFSTDEEMHGTAHSQLMSLRENSLADEEEVRNFFEKIIASLTLEGSYLILMASEIYDVPYMSTDGDYQDDSSEETFNYFICCVCPVKETKASLKYILNEDRFHTEAGGRIVSPPELGFMFPSFDNRATNIHNALYYTKNIKDNHPEFVDAVFSSHIPMPAASQLAVFGDILQETLQEECSYEVISTMQEHITDMVENHKMAEEDETLTVSKRDFEQVFDKCGVSNEKVAQFEEKYEKTFGEDARLVPANVVPKNKFEVKTPDISIKVNPNRMDLVETRVIDGEKYIVIRAADGVEVNGVGINID